jgi:hypothetical protein
MFVAGRPLPRSTRLGGFWVRYSRFARPMSAAVQGSEVQWATIPVPSSRIDAIIADHAAIVAWET